MGESGAGVGAWTFNFLGISSNLTGSDRLNAVVHLLRVLSAVG